jgi:propanediol dehydratase small subunit
MGIRWRRRFPDALKRELREFLTLFVDAFCFEHKRRTCFSPDDRVMDIYRADYPPGSLADSMELEALGLSLEERYGIDFTALWHEDITLGELYEHSRRQAA